MDEEIDEEVRAAFALFDRDGKGLMQTSDLKALMYSLGIRVSKQQLKSLLLREGKAGFSTLDLQEVLTVVTPSVRQRTLNETDDQLFEALDIDGNGAINLTSLKQVAIELGESFNDDELAEMLEEAAADSARGITKDEFLAVMRRWRTDDDDL